QSSRLSKSYAWLWACLVVVVFAAGACSGDSATTSSTSTPRRTTTSSSSTTTTEPSTSTPTSSAATTSTTAEPCAPPVGGSVLRQTSPMPSDVMLSTAVKVTTTSCTDTVQFDFDSGAPEAPGYTVEYRKGPFVADPSGKPLAVAGSAFLVVRLEPATGFDFVKNRQSYTGPDRIPVRGGAYTTELVRTGDFESVTTWVIGLRVEMPFTVQSAGAPNHHLTVSIP
ncbi:MAG: hypothetical protein QOI55_156, partial [Actinomycetota bacterium]|nr:hypothetical protein [Actinomycetota bacterium]